MSSDGLRNPESSANCPRFGEPHSNAEEGGVSGSKYEHSEQIILAGFVNSVILY